MKKLLLFIIIMLSVDTLQAQSIDNSELVLYL